MNKSSKKILVVGLFVSEKNKKKVNRSAADQLADLLSRNGYSIITVSTAVNRLLRFLDTLYIILTKSRQYKIAIVPLYGTLFSYWWIYTSCLLLRLLRKRIIVIVHGGSIPAQLQTNAAKYLKVLHKAEVVICPSLYMGTELQKHGVESLLIENVINLNDYIFHGKQRFSPRLLWMRTLHPIYNPLMAVRVAAILAKEYPALTLVMAGRDEGELNRITTLAEQLNIQHQIQLPGYLSNKEKNEYASQLDIYICTNRIDNAPVSLIEMMALGLPIVSVNVGGIPYLISDNINGLLVDLDDDQAMAACIKKLVEDKDLGNRLVANGVQFCKQYGEEPVMKKWKQLFDKMDLNK